MNPNLPVGGSTDIDEQVVNARAGTFLFSGGYQYARFDRHLRGTEKIEPKRTESIDAHFFNLSARYQLIDPLQISTDIPMGAISVVPLGEDSQVVSGLGDVSFGLATALHWLFRLDPKIPILFIEGHVLTPTGASRRVEESGGAPPNLIAVGNGTWGARLRGRLQLNIAKKWFVATYGGWMAPFQFNKNHLKFGDVWHAGLSGRGEIMDGISVALDLVYRYRDYTEERSEGRVLNSGGHVATLTPSVFYRLDEKLGLSVNGQIPFYNNPNGEQIVQTWGIGMALSYRLKPPVVESHNHDHHDHDHAGHDSNSHEKTVDEIAVRAAAEAPSLGAESFVNEYKRGGQSFDVKDAAVHGTWVVLDFWAEWCAPCKDVTALLSRMAADLEGRLIVKTIEVPSFESPVAVEHLQKVKGLPVVWIIKPDGTIHKKLDAIDIVSLENELHKAIPDSKPTHKH